MTRFNDKKILIIEDDADVVMLYKVLLAREGFREIRHTDRGDEGVEMAKSWRPDLIISDIRHPCLDGLGVFKELFLAPSNLSTRFILITGCSRKGPMEHLEKARAVGVSLYLEKPITPEKFLRAVQKVFEDAEEETRKGL